MKIEEYLVASEQTERKFPEGLVVDGQARDIYGFLEQSILTGYVIDLFKKHLVYGKPIDEVMLEHYEFLLTDGKSDAQSYVFKNKGKALTPKQAEALHALIGMVSEMAELSAAMMGFIFHDKPVDVVNMAEELADLDWYRAILMRLWDLDEGEWRERNIDKLRARYPDKFDAARALNRNLKVERAILEGC